MNNPKKKLNVGKELVKRTKDFNKNLDKIISEKKQMQNKQKPVCYAILLSSECFYGFYQELWEAEAICDALIEKNIAKASVIPLFMNLNKTIGEK
jgi:hypothetical protein